MRRTTIIIALNIMSLVAVGATATEPRGRFVDVNAVAPLEDAWRDCCNPMSPDSLLIMFSSNNRPGASGWDIFQASRPSPDAPFGPAILAEDLNTSFTDAPSGFSADGRTLFLYSNRLGGEGNNDIYMATRTDLDDPFEDVENLGPGVNSARADASAVVSSDGRTLYFRTNRDGVGDLWQATRNDPHGQFDNATRMENVNSNALDDGPTVSTDGLHLFFFSFRTGKGELFAASRTDTEEPFGEPVNLNDFSRGSRVNGEGIDTMTPYLSADWPAVGSKLYFTRVVNPMGKNIFEITDWDLYEATWVSWIGDANLDGEFNSSDLVAVFTAGEFEDGIQDNSTWAEGDWNSDGEFDSGDLVAAFTDGGFEQGPMPVNAVPEPAIATTLLAGLIGFVICRRLT